jgi:hypothetical protein
MRSVLSFRGLDKRLAEDAELQLDIIKPNVRTLIKWLIVFLIPFLLELN